jgi:hypothetical protein
MNRLLFILLLAAGTAYGQINNPPTSVNIVDSTATGRAVLTATNAAAAREAIGLASTNQVVFSNVVAGRIQSHVSSALNTLDLENAALFNGTNTVFGWGSTDVTFAVPIDFTSDNVAATTRTNLGLGATNDVTFSNITATGNATLNGVGNTAPSQTASSGSSLMTRDLVGQEFANPRTKMQTTYWFGLEGLGLWQFLNSGATAMANRGPKFGPSLAFYTSSKPATTAAGAGVRLGANSITGSGAWRPIDGGAFTSRTHVVNYYSSPSVGNRAFGFSFAPPLNTNFWAAPDSFGLFWVEQPTNSWASNAVVAQHERISVSNVVWAVSTTGTNGATEPTWTDLIGSLVTNGSAVYRNIGPHTSNNWVLAIGHTNASQVVMTNTGKSNWLRAAVGGGHEVLLSLRYGTNTTAPYTVYGSVADGTGQGSEVTLNLATNSGSASFSPQYWLRYDGTNTAVGNEAAGIRYFSIDAETPPLN